MPLIWEFSGLSRTSYRFLPVPFQRLFQRPHSSFVSRERTRTPGKKRGSYLQKSNVTVWTVFLTPLAQQNVRNNPGSTRCAWAGSLGMIRVTLGGSVTGARWRIRNCRVSACTASLIFLGVRGRPKIDSSGLFVPIWRPPIPVGIPTRRGMV